MWSPIGQNMAWLCSKYYFWKKVRFHVFSFLIFLYFETIAKQFLLKLIFFPLSILSSILSRSMCKSRCKLRDAKIYPHEVQILHIFFLCHFKDNFGNLSTKLNSYYQTSFSKLEFLFSAQGSMSPCLETCVNCVTN